MVCPDWSVGTAERRFSRLRGYIPTEFPAFSDLVSSVGFVSLEPHHNN